MRIIYVSIDLYGLVCEIGDYFLPIKIFFIHCDKKSKANMTRLYGRALQCARCYDRAPDGRWECAVILFALKYNGETCDIIFEGALDSAMYMNM